MSYISTLRVQVTPGSAPHVEQLVRERLVPARQDLLRQGEVLSLTVIRAQEPADTYEVITRWATKEAHDRSENSPAEQAGLAAVAAYLAAPPVELTGHPLVDLP